MAGADKRAKLLSDLMAAKGAATSGDSRAAEGERERTSVIQIANRRLLEDRAAEPAAAPAVLYSKGAATAAAFRPSYWSFDHDQQAELPAAPADAAPAPSVPAAPSHARNSKPLPVNFVVGFGCLALVVSTTLFVLSFWHRGEPPSVQPEPTQIATAPAPAASVLAAPLPPEPPAVSAPAPPAPAAPAAIPAAPPPAASEPPPAPTIATPAVETPAEPAPAVATAPAPSPNPNPEADALLARGDDLLATGDVAAARLFYQRAAEQGSAAAATAVGQTYDPAVLELLRVRGGRGDARMAAEWYRKAIAAGDRQAEIRLKRLLARPPS
jgi:outer membrane biosynthesis protein TonB